jgi:hypothetical protein
MSRSYKKHGQWGNCESERWWRRLAHRRRRRWERANPDVDVRDEREFGDPWVWPNDGCRGWEDFHQGHPALRK